MSIYYIDSSQLRVIQRVMKRLYTEQRLNGDEMRDLANALDAVTHSVLTYGEADESNEKELLQRLSHVLTGGNASTWDQIEHAIAILKERAVTDERTAALTPARADHIVDLVTDVVHGLADQQAMPDEAWKPKLDAIIATIYGPRANPTNR